MRNKDKHSCLAIQTGITYLYMESKTMRSHSNLTENVIFNMKFRDYCGKTTSLFALSKIRLQRNHILAFRRIQYRDTIIFS